LKPHLVKRFRTSNDPQFAEKLEDVIGLYLAPPENTVVLCVDEKSQIQALERSQPILPLRDGIPERQSHDYHRHGITTLFAALEVASGKVIGECKDRHGHSDYIEFLSLLDRRCPRGGSEKARIEKRTRSSLTKELKLEKQQGGRTT